MNLTAELAASYHSHCTVHTGRGDRLLAFVEEQLQERDIFLNQVEVQELEQCVREGVQSLLLARWRQEQG